METVRAYASEYRIRKKDGAIVWVEENGQIFYDIQGKIDHESGVFFNITSKIAAKSFSLQGREPEGLSLNYCNNEVILPDVPNRLHNAPPIQWKSVSSTNHSLS